MNKYIKLKYILTNPLKKRLRKTAKAKIIKEDLENFKNPQTLKKEWHTQYIQEMHLTSLGCVLNYSFFSNNTFKTYLMLTDTSMPIM
jgi:hypothetical protein